MEPQKRKSPEMLNAVPNRDIAKTAPIAGRMALGTLFDEAALHPNAEVISFDALRATAYQSMEEEISARLASNPTPTIEERLMGTYVEALEPQVRSATQIMRAKGYNTTASGFHGSGDDWRVMGIDNPLRTYDEVNRRGQVMDFQEPFTLSSQTLSALQEAGAEMPQYPGLEGQVVRIGFTPSSPDLAQIEAQWNAVASVLPDMGTPAGPLMGSLEATEFGIYCPPDINWPTEDFNAIATQAVTGPDISGGAAPAGGMSAGGE